MSKFYPYRFSANRSHTEAGIILLIIILISLSGCKLSSNVTNPPTTSGTPKESTISGQVINYVTGIPVDSVYIQLIGPSINLAEYTDSKGKYSFNVSLTGNTGFTIIVYKANYKQDSTLFSAASGVDFTVNIIKLIPVTSGGGEVPSGNPVSIFLASQTSDNISVKESGSPETAGLTFEAEDSAGVPIDLAHSVNVKFSLGAHPGGGEFLSPAVVQTNDKGQATVNLTSGTKSGVVQIIAEIDLPGETIKSKPVNIAIYGGLPDLAHFSISTTQVNFADPDSIDMYLNYPNAVKIFVGDKYGNPVRPNTVVYLTSDGGYVQASALTDEMGIASANFVVALPYPINPVLGPGWAEITATTADENNQNISRSVTVLFSGDAIISDISPINFSIPNGGTQTFNYKVSDKYGNPLASGTTINVNLEGKDVAEQGDVNFTLPDTKSKTFTYFQFIVKDTNDTVDVASPVTIKIYVSGPNGGTIATINGFSH